MAEEFALDQVFGNRGAVHFDEHLVLAQALRVDGMGHQFLPRARLAVDQHAAVGRRHELNLLAQRLHRNAFAFDHAARRELLLELTVFLLHLPGIDGILDQDEGLVDRERLFEEVVGAQFGGAHRGFDGAVAGDHDDFGSIFEIANLLQRFEAVHSGQPDIEQHDIEGASCAERPGRPRRCRRPRPCSLRPRARP